MAKKLSRQESTTRLNEFAKWGQSLPKTADWLRDLTAELESIGTADAQAAIKTIRYIDPNIKFLQLSRILRLGEQMAILEMRPIIDDAHEKYVNRPKQLRAGRISQANEKKLEKYQEAIEAMEWARHQYPEAAADDNRTFLKEKAAKYIGIKVGTLNRRLKK